jgi:hypothetical protein
MAGTRPGSQQQQKPRPSGRDDFVALSRRELRQESAATAGTLADGCCDFDLAVDAEQPGTFVDLVVRESLALAMSTCLWLATFGQRLSVVSRRGRWKPCLADRPIVIRAAVTTSCLNHPELAP